MFLVALEDLVAGLARNCRTRDRPRSSLRRPAAERRTAGARPLPNTPSTASTPPPERGKLLPMCPVRSVTYVLGRSVRTGLPLGPEIRIAGRYLARRSVHAAGVTSIVPLIGGVRDLCRSTCHWGASGEGQNGEKRSRPSPPVHQFPPHSPNRESRSATNNRQRQPPTPIAIASAAYPILNANC